MGNRRYVNYVKLDHYRYVNNNDIVTRVPPAWFGFRHGGSEIYLSRDGRIDRHGTIDKRRDRWQAFWNGLRRRKIDLLEDHSIHTYIGAIANALAAEQVRVDPPSVASPTQPPANESVHLKRRG